MRPSDPLPPPAGDRLRSRRGPSAWPVAVEGDGVALPPPPPVLRWHPPLDLDVRGLGVLGALETGATRHKVIGSPATPAQVALAWLMARPSIAAPIVSATSEAQLKEFLGDAHIALIREDEWNLDRANSK